MKTWIYWYDHLTVLYKQLDPECRGIFAPNAPSFKSTAYLSFVRRLHEQTISEVVSAIATFSATEQLPAISSGAIYCLHDRVRIAHDFIYPLMIRKRGYTNKLFIPSADKGTTDEEIWLWLLIDLWNGWGESQCFMELEKNIRSDWFHTGSFWRKDKS